MALTPEQRARALALQAEKMRMKQSQPGTTLEYRTGMGASTAGSDTLNYRPEMAASSTQGETMQYRGQVAPMPRPAPVDAPTSGLTAEQRTAALRLQAEKRRKAQAIPQAPKEDGFLTRLGQDFKTRGREVISTGKQAMEGEISPVETGIRVVGQAAALGGDVIGQGLTSVARTVLPRAFREKAAEKVGEAAIAVGLPKAVEKYEAFAQENPRLTKTAEGLVNIASLLPQKKVADVAKVGVAEAGEQASKAMLKRSIASLDDAVERDLVKAIRPPVSKTANSQAMKAYVQKGKEAVNAIVDRKDSLKLGDAELPESLQQFAEAIEQTKKQVFKEYNDKALKAGEAGVKVDLGKAANEIAVLADNAVLQDNAPDVIKYIKDRSSRLSKRGSYTPEQAQEAIKLYNESLESFYRNPSYDSATRAAVDAVIVNNIRQGLDEAIEGIAGEGYQRLKNLYGSLRTIESDVAKRAIVDARKNAAGLIDFTDILTGASAAEAILSMNPAQFVASGVAKGIKGYLKYKNDPNVMVKNLFKRVKNVKEKAAKRGITSKKSTFIPKRNPAN